MINKVLRYRCVVTLIALCLISPIASRAQTSSAQTKPSAGGQKNSYLDELSSLPKWFKSIIPMLQSQGNGLDREKLRDKLKLINEQLASTEQLNLQVVAILKTKLPDYNELYQKLNEIKNANEAIANAIGNIRSELHLQGETEYERQASDVLVAKGFEVNAMLEKLQYSKALDEKDHAALQAQSDKLVALIRQVEDAVSAAYKSLQGSEAG